MIGARTAPLLPQSKFFTSAVCIFSTMRVFACVCSFRLSVVIRVRPAPSFDQYGLLASTACTFLRRLMFISFWYLLKNLRASAAGGLFWIAWVVTLRLPAPLGRPDPQRHSKEAVWAVSGCLLEISGPHLGGFPAPTGTPKSLQGRGQYEAYRSPTPRGGFGRRQRGLGGGPGPAPGTGRAGFHRHVPGKSGPTLK